MGAQFHAGADGLAVAGRILTCRGTVRAGRRPGAGGLRLRTAVSIGRSLAAGRCRCWTGSIWNSSPARSSPWWGRAAPARAPSRGLLLRLPPAGRRRGHLDGDRPSPHSTQPAGGARSHGCRSGPTLFAGSVATTSDGCARCAGPARRRGTPPPHGRPTSSWPTCATATTRGSATAAARCPSGERRRGRTRPCARPRREPADPGRADGQPRRRLAAEAGANGRRPLICRRGRYGAGDRARGTSPAGRAEPTGSCGLRRWRREIRRAECKGAVFRPLVTTLGGLLASGAGLEGAVLIAILALNGVALIATSGYLISRAAQRPPVLALTVTIVLVRFFGLGPGRWRRYLDRLTSHDLALRSLGTIRAHFFARIEPLAPGQLDGFRRGDLVARMVGDVDRLDGLYVRGLCPPLSGLAVAVACSVAAAVMLPIAGAILARRPGRRPGRACSGGALEPGAGGAPGGRARAAVLAAGRAAARCARDRRLRSGRGARGGGRGARPRAGGADEARCGQGRPGRRDGGGAGGPDHGRRAGGRRASARLRIARPGARRHGDAAQLGRVRGGCTDPRRRPRAGRRGRRGPACARPDFHGSRRSPIRWRRRPLRRDERWNWCLPPRATRMWTVRP